MHGSAIYSSPVNNNDINSNNINVVLLDNVILLLSKNVELINTLVCSAYLSTNALTASSTLSNANNK